MKNESRNMEFTGERYVPDVRGNIGLEHVHRYLLATKLVAGKVVLDIASGEGYGSAILADKAKKVIGVDISDDAISYSQAKYQIDNLEFIVGSCSDIPLSDSSVDVVVSFETLEHHNEHDAMMREIRRVLRPDGILIISSPDKLEYSDKPKHSNPHHVKELYREEFRDLLESYFKYHSVYGQRIAYGSVIFSEDTAQHIESYQLTDSNLLPASGIAHALYLVAIASDAILPSLANGLLEQDIDDSEIGQLWREHLANRDKQVKELNSHIEELGVVLEEQKKQISIFADGLAEWDARIAEYSEAVAERDRKIHALTDETIRRGEWALGLEAELKQERARLTTIIHSNSWRLTLPLRELKRWLSAPRLQAKRYIRFVFRLAKRGYQSLPLDYKTRAAHRRFIAKYFPNLLLHSGSGAMSFSSANASAASDRIVSSETLIEDCLAKGNIEIPSSHAPMATIIIPVYGKIDYTLRCLASIAVYPPKTPFEVIVVDDNSPDNTVEALSAIKGIRVISNRENQGFIRSCNFGAESANGQLLCFLNNDTEVSAGWLDELCRTFSEFTETGLVGSKLLYPDGRLQEAGGIIWSDGTAWNYGRYQDPSLPAFNYTREVDYCSGASIMVPKPLFEEIGGFDEHYYPAYCEDSDLALKIREKGYRVLYQPLSVVVHYEGVTSGTDTSQGTKAYQIENSKKLYQRWKSRLKQYQPSGEDVDRAKDRDARFRVLVLDHCTPTPDQDAGSVTVFNLLLLLREMGFQVTFIPESNFLYMPGHTTGLQRVGIEVLYAPYFTSVEQHLKESGARYDLAFLFRPGVVERHLQSIRSYAQNAKILYHTVDLHYLRMSREAELQGDKAKKRSADDMKQRELAAIRAADASIVHSTIELEILQRELPAEKLYVFPLIMNVHGRGNNFRDRRDLIFIGGYQHTPNVDAVNYFVTDIMPLLRERLPGVRFFAAGSRPPAEMQVLASADVIITGFVADLTSLLEKIRVSVAPLRYGAGIKGKIGTAMAAGLPVIATPLAAEGMSLTDGDNILIAEDAKAFTEAIVRLYEDEVLWDKLSDGGLAFAEKEWGAEAAYLTLSEILRGLSIDIKRGKRGLSLYV